MNDDELTALRRRAYGRDGDIHLDPASLQRLRELEDARTELPPEPGVIPDPEPVVVEHRLAHDVEDDHPDPEPAAERVRREPRVLPWLLGLRRSTKLIALAAALVVASLFTALVLVQRVQVDPLQVGAVQFARLNADRLYEAPIIFTGSDEDADTVGEVHGYSTFFGLRAITSSRSFFLPTGEPNSCLSVFVDAKVTVDTDSFDGPFFSGCSAGAFPATIQFTTDLDGLPPELVDAFPAATALQFVFDENDEQVVVFVDQTE